MKIKRLISAVLCGSLVMGCLAMGGCSGDPAANGDTAPTTAPTGNGTTDPEIVVNEKVLDGATIITFGDSLTAFGTWPLSVAEETNMYLFNGATGGINTKEALDLFDRYVATREADFVTLCFGMNDLLMTAKNKPQVTPEKFKENMKALCDKIIAMDATPLLLTSSYLDESKFYTSQAQQQSHYADVGGPLAWLDEYNAKTRELAAEYGYDLIDIREACNDYTPAEFLDGDGIHLGKIGNKVYTDIISDYLKTHYTIDANAEKITNRFPHVSSPAEPATLDIVSYNAEDWDTLTENTMLFENDDNGALLICNMNGQWPDAQYIAEESVYVPYEGTELVYDFSTANVNTSIILFFGGSTPLATTANKYVSINNKLGAKLEAGSGDIAKNQDCQGSIKLTDLAIPSEAIDEKGNILISGVKIFAAGAPLQNVTVRQLAVSTQGAPNA